MHAHSIRSRCSWLARPLAFFNQCPSFPAWECTCFTDVALVSDGHGHLSAGAVSLNTRGANFSCSPHKCAQVGAVALRIEAPCRGLAAVNSRLFYAGLRFLSLAVACSAFSCCLSVGTRQAQRKPHNQVLKLGNYAPFLCRDIRGLQLRSTMNTVARNAASFTLQVVMSCRQRA